MNLLLAVLTGVIAREASAWLPSVAREVIHLAALRFRDRDLADRYREEWLAAIAEIPGPIGALVHAVSLLCSVRSIERSCAAEVLAADVEQRFQELEGAVEAFSTAFRGACSDRGLALEEIHAVTKVSLKDLQALQSGDLPRISMGYLRVFDYLSDLPTMLGPAMPEIQGRYLDLLGRPGGLPPTPAQTTAQRAARIWCGLAGHQARTYFIHSERELPFHWRYRRCSRCGDVSEMRSEPCQGKMVRSKRTWDSPPVERFTCEDDYPWAYRSLESPDWHPRFGRVNPDRERSAVKSLDNGLAAE